MLCDAGCTCRCLLATNKHARDRAKNIVFRERSVTVTVTKTRSSARACTRPLHCTALLNWSKWILYWKMHCEIRATLAPNDKTEAPNGKTNMKKKIHKVKIYSHTANSSVSVLRTFFFAIRKKWRKKEYKKKIVSSFTFGLWLLHHFVNSTSKETRSDKSSARQTKRFLWNDSPPLPPPPHMPNDRENKRDAKSKTENKNWK